MTRDEQMFDDELDTAVTNWVRGQEEIASEIAEAAEIEAEERSLASERGDIVFYHDGSEAPR